MREEFEAWATKHRMPIHRDGVVTDYAARCTDECWQAWKASRAALRVELPPTITAEEVVEHFNIDEEGIDMAAGIAHMVNGAIWSCAAFIKQAGIEVKHGTA
ncbi:TPA: hypothetical protein ACIR1N_006041 [Pseudomonas aeruginosa]|uniref:hypothetical protein n=2 Tax=Pseudomonas aeruginosa TaxID=287 RepID=UPI0035CD4645